MARPLLPAADDTVVGADDSSIEVTLTALAVGEGAYAEADRAADGSDSWRATEGRRGAEPLVQGVGVMA